MIVWVDGVFTRWGVWLQTNRGRGSAGLTADWTNVGRSNFRQAVVPVRDLDCSRINDWVEQQDLQARQLLMEVYCTTRSSVEHAIALSLSTRTLYARLHTLQTRYAESLAQKKNKNNYG